VRDDTLSRPAFVEQMNPIHVEVESLLLRGSFNARLRLLQGLVGASPKNLWTSVEVEVAKPTNNAAEQAMRQAVIGRKLSFGTHRRCEPLPSDSLPISSLSIKEPVLYC
jgi:hypothetical protein